MSFSKGDYSTTYSGGKITCKSGEVIVAITAAYLKASEPGRGVHQIEIMCDGKRLPLCTPLPQAFL